MKKLGIVMVLGIFFVLAALPVSAQTSPVCAATVTVQPNDTLSQIAAEHLGSLQAYQAIVEATNAAAAEDDSFAHIADPNRIDVGWKLCIPTGGQARATVTATATAGRTGVPTATPSPTPTPVPADEHPLRIDQMRQRAYPGSPITIERTLSPETNYNRYVVSYRSDGLKIYALMTVPLGEKPESGWPVIVFNHGHIPPQIYRTTERYVAYVDAFARNGYIVFKSDYRGHGNSEGEPVSAHASPGYTVDVLNAMASLQRYADADPDRIGMWGHSMGGSIVLRAMVIEDDIKAGVIWAGVVASYPDLVNRSELQDVSVPEWLAEWRDKFIDAYGRPEENPDFWQAISPNSYLSDLSGPIQLHHASGDDSVPVEYSDVLYDQIQAVDGEVEYYRYSGDNHNLSGNFATAMARSIAFFDRYVKEAAAE